jgi:CheY-like chemotaxis protein
MGAPESKSNSGFVSNGLVRILCLQAMPEALVPIEAIYQLAGFETVGTTDCYRALHLLKTQRVDLFTQNIERPEMDGMKLYSLLKSDPKFRLIKVLFISGHSGSRYFREIYPADGFLSVLDVSKQLLLATAELLKDRSPFVELFADGTLPCSDQFENLCSKWPDWPGLLQGWEDNIRFLKDHLNHWPSETTGFRRGAKRE